MKIKNITYITILLSVFFSFHSCKDWVKVENKNIDELLVDADNDLVQAHKNYYDNLRAYKNTEHELTFGWFAAWAADGPGSTYLSQLPDSVDIVALWGEKLWARPTKAMLEDLKYAQTVKGIKVVTACLLFDIGKGITPDMPKDFGVEEGIPENERYEKYVKSYWGWVDGDEDKILQSIEKYANALCDTIYKFGYDGFDLDAEPSYAQPFQTNKEMWRPATRMFKFIETMTKRLGPKAETEEGRKKIFIVDGEPDWFPAKYGPYINYFVLQAYGSHSFNSLDVRYKHQKDHFASVHTPEEVASKLIVTEEFERYSGTGGVDFQLPNGDVVPSYIGMAMWKPEGKYKKGGIGSYHMQKDFAANPKYKYLRQGIRIMNPEIK